MTNDEIYMYILKANSNIFKQTGKRGADVLFFEGQRALDFYEERKNHLSIKFYLVPKGKHYSKNRILVTQFGDNIKYVFKEQNVVNKETIPEFNIVQTKEIQPDVIQIIELD